MKLLTLLSILSITISIVAAQSTADKTKESSAVESHIRLSENKENYILLPVNKETASSDEGIYFMLPRGRETCREFPQMCRRRPSPGPDYCGGKCTDVRKDRFNCGRCGCKCKHNEICCGGHCVNPSFDPHHCGSCAKHCKKWETCVYRMCTYALLLLFIAVKNSYHMIYKWLVLLLLYYD